MRSKNQLSLLIAVLIIAVPFFAEDKITESTWTAQAPQVDGLAVEWAQSVLALNKSNDIRYAFKNDAVNLYLLFIFNESKSLSSIAVTGMTFWVNTEGKEKKTHGLRFYQKTLNGQQLIREMEDHGEPIPEEKKAEFLNTRNPFKLYGCDVINKKGEAVPSASKGVATYRIGRDGKDTVYEFVIPLVFLKDPASQTAFDGAQPFKFGFEWGGTTKEIRQAQMSQLGEQGVRATAAAGNFEGQIRGEDGEDFSSPSSDISRMRRRLPKKYDFWINLLVARNP